MITYIILFQTLFHLLASCPTICICEDDIVTCVNSFLDGVPSNLPSSTRILYLSHNRIRMLTDASFSGLHDLEELHIQNNMITTINRNTFRTNVKLKLLNLMNNNLHEMSATLFDKNNFLTGMDVRNNPQLTYIPYQLIQNCSSFKSLIANNVECDCDMSQWHDNMHYFQMNDIQIDITCYNPSTYRGYRFENLPYRTFAGCTPAVTSSPCKPGEVLCDVDYCIDESVICDGIYDCQDFSDENECSEETPTQSAECGLEELQCSNGGCVPVSWVCDGFDDCKDEEKSDEVNCIEVVKCESGEEFECNNKRCVPLGAMCNGSNECGDWSDESKLMCGEGETANICPTGWPTTCASGGQCLQHAQLCNGVPDCADKSDEANCHGNCSEAQCVSDGRCIKHSWVCDTVPDCSDSSDEANCDYACAEGEVKCGIGGCVRCQFVCDGYDDCVDRKDETSCASCNGSLCLELEQTKSGVTTIIIIATTVSACISICSVVLFIVVYRQRRKGAHVRSRQPPLYTEIEYSFRGDMPSTPPPRYKSEPDISARLMSVEPPNDQYRHVNESI